MPILCNQLKELGLEIGNWANTNANFPNLLKELEIGIGNWNNSNANFLESAQRIGNWSWKLEYFQCQFSRTHTSGLGIGIGNWNISNANFLDTV